MRITNKIMQNNSVANINTNKLLQDQLNTQITTQSKIVRPSDDPVVAIRALRLRSNLSEVSQYYDKNIPDAKSWMSVTEEALKTMTSVLTDMMTNCSSGAKGSLQSADRLKILENLKGLRDEVYVTGDADYAGRNIFTGYRTNERLSFQNDTSIPYSITEQLTRGSMDSFIYVDTKDLKDITGSNFGSSTTTEEDIKDAEIYRIRLSYDSMDNKVPTLKLKTGVNPDGSNIYGDLMVGGNPLVIESYSKFDTTNNPYELAKNNPDKAYFIPETGELLLGKNVKAAVDGLPREQEIAVTYEKSDWDKGDLRPEHYFACSSNKGAANEVTYNEEYLTNRKAENISQQIISYDVGFNQDIRVNTRAGECFTHNIGRDVDELMAITQEAEDMSKIVADLDSMLNSGKYTDAEKAQIQTKLTAANKAYTLLNDKCQKMFEHGITQMQGYLDQTNLAMTNVGSRSTRLAMVENRLKSQKASFQELQSDNEGADVTALAIQLKSAQLSYDAALMATGKIIQNSLMNFI